MPDPLNLSVNTGAGSKDQDACSSGIFFIYISKQRRNATLDKETVKKQIIEAVGKVRNTCPMAGSITNSVTINFVANAQLAVGGSAAMVYLPDEAEALAKLGGAFYINVGTLLPVYEESLPLAAKTLSENNKQWVLDPVAVGLGALRTKLLLEFRKYKPSIIRGNASEIIALAGLWELKGGADSKVRGVDSTEHVNDARSAAVALARFTGGAVAVSGETDLVTDGSIAALSHGGSVMMTRVTGSGCSLGGVMAVYAACASPFIAALAGTAVYNFAGARAERKADGSGSFQTIFIDELYNASAADIADNPFEIEEA
jgi:hydroxyethylthiazole kinase